VAVSALEELTYLLTYYLLMGEDIQGVSSLQHH